MDKRDFADGRREGGGGGGTDNGSPIPNHSGEGEPDTGQSGKKNGAMRLVGTLQQSRLDPYEIEFLPEFARDRGPRQPFVNEHGVVIGDHEYASPNSPLENWSEETDPAIMAGDQWVHPYKDIGFHTAENKALFEKGIPPQSGRFVHPMHDAARNMDEGGSGESGEARESGGEPVVSGDGEGADLKDGGGCRA